MVSKKIIKVKLDDLRKLGALQCSLKEVAGFFGMTRNTLLTLFEDEPRAREAFEQGIENGKVSIRRKQMRLAAVNATMAIFMGKQYLGQKDIIVNELSGVDGEAIEIADVSLLTPDERKNLRALLTKTQQQSPPKETR